MAAISSPLTSGVVESLGAVRHNNLVTQQPDGTFSFASDIDNIAALCADNLLFRSKITGKQVLGVKHIRKFGSSLVGATLQPLTISGNYNTPTTPQSLVFISDDVNDNSTGTGAREVIIQGLGADWTELEQKIVTNGTTEVPIPIDFTRVHTWWVSQSGTYATPVLGSHAGNLNIQTPGGGSVWSTIPNTPFPFAQSQIGVYSVPFGKTGFILSKRIAIASTKIGDIYLFQRTNISNITEPFDALRIIERDIGALGASPVTFKLPIGPFIGPCDVGFMGSVTQTTGIITCEFEILLVDN